MTDTCACPPGACVDDKTRAMAAELLSLRARVAELEAAQREPLGYVVLAKRPSRSRPGESEYAPAGSVWPDLDPVENHQGWCEGAAESDPERFGGTEYVIAELREREVGAPVSRSIAKAAGFFGYIPAVTRTGRGLEPADHHRVAQDPGPVAVWSDGPPEPPGRLIGYAVAFNDGGGWQVDTVRLDGSWDDAELRHHDWLSGGGYQALVVELREVGE
ncbi:hypothetical protein ACFYTF_29225 [Nocardia thailandica]|uniref:Uncharacterized protein n=1 Tax=Nocardia thailandica TaxID=257275 RepID=A0ABW6PWV3_9NOCA